MIHHKRLPHKRFCASLLLIALMFAYCPRTFAQTAPLIDSLEQALQNHPSRENRLRIYDDLSWALMVDNLEKSSFYARQGIQMAESDKKWYEAAQLYCTLGTAYYYADRLDSALIVYQTALQTAEQISVKNKQDEQRRDHVLSKVYGNIGNLYGVQTKDNLSLHYYLKAKELFEKWDNQLNLTILYGNIGQLYISLENYELALVNFKQAEKGLLAMQDSVQLTYVLDGLCTVYCQLSDFEKALECAELQYKIHSTHSEGTQHGKMLAELSLANVWASGNQLDKAHDYASQALKSAEDLHNPFYQATALARLAKYSLYSGQYAQSRAYAQRSIQIDTADSYRLSRLYNVLSATEFASGNHLKARGYASQSEELLQQRVNKQYQQSLMELELTYETEKKQMQIDTLMREKRLFLLLAVAGCGLTLMVFILFLYHKRLHRRQRQLVATQAVLDGETAERSRLARDLHDGLGSMLTGVKLNLESAKKDIAPKDAHQAYFDTAFNMLNESMLELRRVAHHLMPDSLNRHGLKTALTDFCNHFSLIQFDYFGSEERLDSKMEVMIYRIVHELVNNALKHSGASQIMVQIMRENDYIGLIVRDNGSGFDPAHESGRGMGLQNIRARVASYNGRMEMSTASGQGCEINIEFTLSPKDHGNK